MPTYYKLKTWNKRSKQTKSKKSCGGHTEKLSAMERSKKDW